MTVAQKVLIGLGDNFAERAGVLLPDIIEAVTAPADVIDNLLQPAPGGWPVMLDLATTPQPWWIGQLVGVHVSPAIDPAAQRIQIAAHLAWKRGTPAAIVALTQTLLEGTRFVSLLERSGNAWTVRVHVLPQELIDPGTTEADIEAVLAETKPIGVRLYAVILDGSLIVELESAFPTILELEAALVTVDSVIAWIPTT